MAIQKPQSAASSLLAVSTVAGLFDLINTAGSTSLPFAGFVDPKILFINCEDGSIRVASGVNPTTTEGELLTKGQHVLNGIEDLRLVATAGTVSCSVLIS